MKRLAFISVILLCIPFLSFAQEDTLHKSKIYKTWITGGPFEREGVLYQIMDSSLLIANSIYKKDFLLGKYKLTNIKYKNIEIINTRAINGVRNGALLGLAGGLLTGVLIGYSQGGEPRGFYWFTAKEKAIIGGLIGGLSGAGIGTWIGSIKIKIPINGSFENFNKNKQQLKTYSYIH
jgi:hypothetical protein